MEMRVLTADVPMPLADKVDELAARHDRSRASIVEEALSHWVALEERRDFLTLEGLADVDAGNLIDHEDVLKWAAKLDSDRPLQQSAS